MFERPNLAPDRIVELVRAAYQLTAERADLLQVGADEGAAVYRVECVEGPYFLKLRRGDPPPGAAAARVLADSGIAEVLAPVRAQDGQVTIRVGDCTAIVYPFSEGPNGFEAPLSDEHWAHLGATLRAVHDVALPRPTRDSVRVDSFGPRWRARLRARLDGPPLGGPARAESREVAELLTTRRTAISAILDHAEELAPAVRAKAAPLVLCHGDLHAGNVLVGSGGALAIIDWDDAVLAPRERDLMFVGGGVGGAWNVVGESEAFYRGYGCIPVDAGALAYYRCERIVEDIVVFDDHLAPAPAPARGTDRADLLRKLRSMFGPGNVVEIAEQTYARL
jgi:spectinomycin phosphotransferase